MINDGEARRYLKCPTKVSTMLRLFLRHCVKIVRKIKSVKLIARSKFQYISPVLLETAVVSVGHLVGLFRTVSRSPGYVTGGTGLHFTSRDGSNTLEHIHLTM